MGEYSYIENPKEQFQEITQYFKIIDYECLS